MIIKIIIALLLIGKDAWRLFVTITKNAPAILRGLYNVSMCATFGHDLKLRSMTDEGLFTECTRCHLEVKL